MSERAYRDQVDPGLGICADIRKGDPAGCFQQRPSIFGFVIAYYLDCFADHLRRHVIEEQHIGFPFQRFVDLFDKASFRFAQA